MEIRVLGPVEIVADDGSRLPVAKQPRRLLAALIAQAGRTASSDYLIEALWGESPPPSAEKLLQVYVSQLRKAVPDQAWIQTQGSGYRIERGEAPIDADQFERLVEEARAASVEGNAELAASRLRRATALWRGAAYGEFAYENFARHEAERLENLRWDAIEERIDAELGAGRHAELLSDLHGLAALEPLRERLQAQLMLALFRSGRQSEALEVYDRARSRLVRDLGIDPGDELEGMQRRILQHDPTLVAPAPKARLGHPLPSSPNAMLGRERELLELRDLLGRRQVRFLVLTGAGGSGKTRLALEAARSAQGSFAQGAVFVDLAPLDDASRLLPAISRALGLTEKAGESLDALSGAIRPNEILLVLDNAEHLRSAASMLPELLAKAPYVTVLVTSRVVLHVRGEHVFPVQPLAEEAAVELLLQRAREAGAAIRDEGPDAEVLRLICGRLDRLPLAIELAASRTRVLAPPLLLARLEARLPILTGGPHDLPARQRTLRATLAWSHDLLSPDAQRLFRRLAVFAAGSTLEAAESVADASLDQLQALVEHSLVRHESGRILMFETIREFATERLEEDGDASAVRDGHMAYYLDLAERAEPELSGERQADWFEVLDRDAENFRAALRWSLGTGQSEHALRLVGALTPFWYRRGYLSEAAGWISRALAIPHPSGSERVKALGAAAVIASVRGDWDAATRWSDECHAMSLAIGDVERTVSCLLTLGRATLGKGDRDRARAIFRQATTVAENPGVSRSTAALAAFNLGYAALADGDHDEARRQIEVAQASFNAAGDAYGLARSLAALGAIALHEERPGEARPLLRESLAISQRLGDRDDIAWALELTGVALARSQGEQAAQLLGAAEALRDSLGIALEGAELALHERALEAVEAAIDPGIAASAWAAGRSGLPEDAVALALSSSWPATG